MHIFLQREDLLKKIISFAMNISALLWTTDFVGCRDMDSYTEDDGFFGLLGDCLAEAGCFLSRKHSIWHDNVLSHL